MPVTAVDLFCGAGGLTRGLLDAGISVAAGIDFACAQERSALADIHSFAQRLLGVDVDHDDFRGDVIDGHGVRNRGADAASADNGYDCHM